MNIHPPLDIIYRTEWEDNEMYILFLNYEVVAIVKKPFLNILQMNETLNII